MTPKAAKFGRARQSFCLAGVLVGMPLLAVVGYAQGAPMYSDQQPIWLDGSVGSSAGVARPVPIEGDTFHIGEELGAYSADGETLFHSFLYFGLPIPDTIAWLQAGADTQRILARVTGGLESDINGMIRAEPDLFLMNPAGIKFGSSAELDVGGSFHATTADTLAFGEGTPDFEASATKPPPLMAVAAPSAFGFTSAAPKSIVVKIRQGGVYDDFDSGETFSLVGGDVSFSVLEERTESIRLPRATVQIASAASPITIPVDLGEMDPDEMPTGMGAVSISGVGIRVDGAAGEEAGRIFIRAGSFEMGGGARLDATHNAATDAEGGIDIAARDSVLLGGSSSIEAVSGFFGEGRSGDISIEASTVRLEGGSSIRLAALSDGSTGTLRIGAGTSIQIADSSALVSESSPFGTVISGDGAGAPITLHAASIDVESGGRIQSVTSGPGTGGDVSIVADSLQVREGGVIEAHTGAPLGGDFGVDAASGVGGTITISAASVEVFEGGVIQSRSDAAGRAGDISISAERVEVQGSGAHDSTRISSLSLGEGEGGDLAVVATDVELGSGGQMFADTEGAGDAGDLRILHADRVTLSGSSVDSGGILRPSGLTSRARGEATGSGGRIDIGTRVLEVLDGAQIAVSTLGLGKAGSIDVSAGERITLHSAPGSPESVISAASVGHSAPDFDLADVGDAGVIRLRAGRFEILDGGHVTTSRNGALRLGEDLADAGSLIVEAVDVFISGARSGLFTEAASPPLPDGREARSGGDLSVIASGDVILTDDATLSADSTEGLGDAGNISIRAGGVFSGRQSDVVTEALAASGGEIRIAAGEAVEITDSLVSAEVGFGKGAGGNITIGGLEGAASPVQAVALNRSTIFARAVEGAGGDISIVTAGYLESGDSVLDASSQADIDGRISVSSPANDVTVELAALPVALLDSAAVAASACGRGTGQDASFQVQRRSAPALPPDLAAGWPGAGAALPCAGEEIVQ